MRSLGISQGSAASLDEPHVGLEPLHPLIDGHCQSCLQQPDIVRVWFGFGEYLRQIDRTCPRNGVHHTQWRVTVRPRLNLCFRYSEPASSSTGTPERRRIALITAPPVTI
jgi:hypothetical protein